ncbi:MAG TPA: carbonate dehydratase [Burkholderiales bacterium]|nr:carbonate dehydratase [Burkholderiales bacterium]
MKSLPQLFANNRHWVERTKAVDPEFFRKLAAQQSPQYLWIGCSDSRVPANTIVDLLPGDLFVHRNVGNVVVHTDLNCLSVIQFAVDVLKVRHIIVCGHYGCSGVRCALTGEGSGLSRNWLRHIEDVRTRHAAPIDALADAQRRHDLLCELNVVEQVANVCRTSIVEEAWARGQPLAVHGWVYGVEDGLLRDLDVTVEAPATLAETYRRALARLTPARGPQLASR